MVLLIIVSHDRAFIDQIADTIWDIQEDDNNKSVYTQYQNQYEQEQLEQQRHEQYISENKDCPSKAKRKSSATNGTSIIKTKQKYSTRSFGASNKRQVGRLRSKQAY